MIRLEQTAAPVADGQQGGAHDPAHRVGQGHGDKAEAQQFGDKKVDLPEHHERTEHDDRRLSWKVQRGAVFAEELHQFVIDDFDNHLCRWNGFYDLFTDGFFADGRNEIFYIS